MGAGTALCHLERILQLAGRANCLVVCLNIDGGVCQWQIIPGCVQGGFRIKPVVIQSQIIGVLVGDDGVCKVGLCLLIAGVSSSQNFLRIGDGGKVWIG